MIALYWQNTMHVLISFALEQRFLVHVFTKTFVNLICFEIVNYRNIVGMDNVNGRWRYKINSSRIVIVCILYKHRFAVCAIIHGTTHTRCSATHAAVQHILAFLHPHTVAQPVVVHEQNMTSSRENGAASLVIEIGL